MAAAIALVARQATPADLDALLALYAEIGAWLHDIKGIDYQWPRAWGRRFIERLIAAEAMFAFSLDGELTGACILSARQEPIWDTPAGGALYLHGLAVRRDRAGGGLGRKILRWAESETAKQGQQLLRLDCVAGNSALRDYYSAYGFDEIKVVEDPEHLALFQKMV